MTISAQIIADSVSPEGIRLTTMQLRYPRMVHSEFMTHRVFSRNASSSRAIPIVKMIEDLRRDPAMPVYWGSHKPGMQAGEELPEYVNHGGLTINPRRAATAEWLDAMNNAIHSAEEMISIGLHKQIANRILEPWAHINVVVTATEWANFFALRAHSDAQPEIKELAETMMAAMGQSDPELLAPSQWHLPYCTKQDLLDAGDYFRNTKQVAITEERVLDLLKKVSVARCARVSYLTHDGRKTTVEEDLKLYEQLVVSQPLHASPAEHSATPDTRMEGNFGLWTNPHLHGNLEGWIQLRKTLPNEFIQG